MAKIRTSVCLARTPKSCNSCARFNDIAFLFCLFLRFHRPLVVVAMIFGSPLETSEPSPSDSQLLTFARHPGYTFFSFVTYPFYRKPCSLKTVIAGPITESTTNGSDRISNHMCNGADGPVVVRITGQMGTVRWVR